jgi:serine/threonine protein kinase
MEIAQTGVYKPIFTQLMRAYQSMYRAGIAYLDFKGENILVMTGSDGLRIKLIDFGMARPTTQRFERYGTRFMSSPEILYGRGYKGPEGDIWALGLILYQMASGGRDAFVSESEVMDLVDPVDGPNGTTEWRALKPVELPAAIHGACRRILLRMLDPDPSMRANVDEIIAILDAWP